MEWYYAIDGQRHGPVSAEDFARLVAASTVQADTLVWRAGMTSWQPWAEVAPTVQLPAPTELAPAPVREDVAGGWVATGSTDGMAYGGFWIRLLAKLIDAIALGIVGQVLSMLILGSAAAEMQSLDPEDPEAMARFFALFGQLLLLSLAVGLSYHWFFLAKFAATPGKLALGLRIVRSDGSRLSHGRIVARFFAEYLSSLILYIGYIIAAFDDEKRALHDYLCDTRVVKQR